MELCRRGEGQRGAHFLPLPAVDVLEQGHTSPPSTAKAGGRGWTNQPSETQQGMLASPFVLMDHLGGSAQLETHRRGAVICPPLPEPCPLGSPATAEWEWDQGFRDSGALTAVEKTFQAVAGA